MQLLQSMNRKDIVLSHMSSWPHMIPYIQGFNLDWHFSYRSTLWAQNVSKQQRPPLGRDVEVDIICGNYWGAAPGVTLTLDRDTRGGAGTLGLCDRRRRSVEEEKVTVFWWWRWAGAIIWCSTLHTTFRTAQTYKQHIYQDRDLMLWGLKVLLLHI